MYVKVCSNYFYNALCTYVHGFLSLSLIGLLPGGAVDEHGRAEGRHRLSLFWQGLRVFFSFNGQRGSYGRNFRGVKQRFFDL